uniref:Uncharacterized protein n=1 Tax=Candidozyma auris TaxID=498019 RepID=A0A0L0NYD7_CANAR
MWEGKDMGKNHGKKWAMELRKRIEKEEGNLGKAAD